MQRKIVLFGAGKSASYLIRYLLNNAASEQWHLTVADVSLEAAQAAIKNHTAATAVACNIQHAGERTALIAGHDLVISLLPAHLHTEVARDCVQLKKNMVTASYISEEMKALDQAAKEAGITLVNEIGLDPGIDHLSAIKLLEEIRENGGTIDTFESYTGGLVAPESDNNPWNYKFTWNPRNVVMAGAGGAAKFFYEGEYKYIPYHQLFVRTTRFDIGETGIYEGYANRDSLKYREVYGLQQAKTIVRGTLRKEGFSAAWNVFVQLGMTDDSYVMENSETLSYRQFLNAFLPYDTHRTVEEKVAALPFVTPDILEKLRWLQLFDAQVSLGTADLTPAQALQKILESKWALEANDIDMIVMLHRVGYTLQGIRKTMQSTLVVKGEDPVYTAMAKTVGLPVGIMAKLLLNGKVSQKGVILPADRSLYIPLLEELSAYGIRFTETPS